MPTSVVAEVGSTSNNYQVLAKLAVGGMAEIFLARGASAAGVERYVVLKRILRDKANDTHFVQMFLEEARLAAQLQHPNVAQVYDIGKLGDSYFFTMEYVHGETVRSMLHEAYSQQREIPLASVLSVIAGTAAGLHHAHERIGVDGRPLGIVHRDVSPSNLMVSYEGSVKVVDFGVAKAENRATETRSGTVKGKISYLSPEQCRGAPVDRRSDLFSLGIVLWEMLTADRLYKRGSDFEIMTAIVSEPPPPPSLYRKNLPRELDELTLRLLAKNPADRYQSGDDVVEAVEQVASALSQQLSQKALGRYMRDLFGSRKEPWVDIEAQKPEGVTVISEPLPPEIVAGMSHVDAQLEGLHDLSARAPYSESSVPLRPSMAYQAAAEPKLTQKTMAARPAALSGGVSSQSLTVQQPPPRPTDDYPTVAMIPDQDLLAKVPTVPTSSYRLPTEASSPAMPAMLTPPARGSQTSPPPHPVFTTQAYPQPLVPPSAPPPIPPSYAHAGAQAFTQRYHAPTNPPETTLTTRRSNTALVFAILGGAIVLGAVLAAVLMNKNKTESTEETTATMVMTPSVAPPSDAAAVAPSPDASEAAPPPPVATPVTEEPPAQTKAELIAQAFKEERFADVVTACKEELTSELAPSCTIAACKTRETSKAKSWFGRVSSAAKTTVASECKSAGVELTSRVRTPSSKPEQKAPKTDCAKDPMACQH